MVYENDRIRCRCYVAARHKFVFGCVLGKFKFSLLKGESLLNAQQ
jgi:hypothetical protein